MIDIKAFWKFLLRRKWIIIAVPIITALLTMFLLRNQPDQYKSQARIATGIMDQSQLVSGGQSVDYFKARQLFGNIVEMMKMKRVISSLSFNLILHDLQQPEQAFKPFSEDIQQLSAQQRNLLIATYRKKLANKSVVSISDEIEGIKLFDILASMGYDEKNILENLEVDRSGDSDFIYVRYTAENPELSAYVVNTLSSEFIYFYTSVLSSSQENSLVLLDSLLKDKQRLMDSRNAQLRDYKASSGALNLSTQSETLFQQISEYESRRSQAVQEIESLRGAISMINSRLNSTDDAELGSNVMANNNVIIQIERQLEIANRRYVDNNFSAADKRVVDSLSQLRAEKIRSSVANTSTNPRELRQDLIKERMQLETALSKAENSVASIQADITSLRSRYNQMVPTDAGIHNYEREADLATQEYMEAMNRYNQASLQNTTSIKLSLVELGLPGLPENSKKIIYVGLSGVASAFLCLSFLFLAFIFNRKINNADDLARATSSYVIGNLNLISEDEDDVRTIWNNVDNIRDYVIYKELLRSIRFKINKEMDATNSKIFGITGLDDEDGREFLCTSLAFSFIMMGKKVLLIGENYPNMMEKIMNGKQKVETDRKFETFLTKREIEVDNQFTVLQRNPETHSLLEVQDEKSLASGFDLLKDHFDLVLIDINSLSDTNSANEWLFFTEKSIAVYKAGVPFKSRYAEFADYLNRQPGFIGWVLNRTKYENLQRLV